MKISMKIPEYSIEQGRVFLNGNPLPRELHNKIASRFYGIVYGGENPARVVRGCLFKPVKKGRYFWVKKEYPEKERKFLNQTREGFATYKQALQVYNEVKRGALHGAKITIKSRYIG